MLKNRVVVTLLTDGKGSCLKPMSFDEKYPRVVGSLMEQARVFAARNVDELIILDMYATRENRAPNFKLLREVSDIVYAPITFGGGINTVAHIREALNNGADKVTIRDALSPSFINAAAKYVGSQSVVASVDITNGNSTLQDYTICIQYCLGLQACGIGEILLTDVDRDGTMSGYNIKLIHSVCKFPAIKIPVVANGGAGSALHMSEALKAGASAVAASTMYLYQNITPKGVARELSKFGHTVRV